MYKIEFLPIAARQFRKLPRDVQLLLESSIQGLATEPRPHGCKKLSGIDGWRVRSGNFRIIYQIKDVTLTVLILAVGDRKDVYR